MFDTLLASRAIGAPWTRAVTGALILHSLLIAAALGTASPRSAMQPVARDTIRLELAQVRPSLRESAEVSPSAPETILPQPPGVPDIPFDAPEMQLPTFALNPPGRPQSGRNTLGSWSGEAATAGDTLGQVFSAVEVDQLPELLEVLHPAYPDGLRRAGVSGLVQLEYVVGSDGRMDERSVHVLRSSHPAFLLAALEALRKSRFRPARRGGRPTAVLVQQTIRFSYR